MTLLIWIRWRGRINKIKGIYTGEKTSKKSRPSGQIIDVKLVASASANTRYQIS